MTVRDNLLATLSRKTPEWVPRGGNLSPAQMEHLKERTGSDDPARYFRMDPLGGVGIGRTRLQTDFSEYHRYYAQPMSPDRTRVDEFGVGWVRGSLFHFEDMVHPMHTFTTLEEFKRFPYPDLTADYRRVGVAERVVELHAEGLPAVAAIPCLGGTIFETSWRMRGMENMLADLLVNPDLASYHLDKLTEMAVDNARFLGSCGIDMLHTSDDVATQRGMMMSPDAWRRWFKPRLGAVIAAARERNPNLHVWYHSDGDCRAIIPDLVEIGVTVLNPVQPECMDPAWVKREYGKHLAFWGTIGTQTTLPFGTAAEVRETVKRMIEIVGEGGGLFIAPTHVIEPDVPWENIEALYYACDEFGGRVTWWD